MKLVQVEWVDAQSRDDWADIPHEYSQLLITTVGYLEEINDESMTLLDPYILHSSVTNDERSFGVAIIPKGCVKSIKEIVLV